MKIYKNDNYYRLVQELPSGEVMATGSWETLDQALASIGTIGYGCFNSIKDLENLGFEEMKKRTLETLVPGDIVVDEEGEYSRILTRSGIGELTVFLVSRWSRDLNSDSLKRAGGHFTTFELKECDWKPYTKEVEEEDKEVEKALALLEKKGKIVNGKVVRQ